MRTCRSGVDSRVKGRLALDIFRQADVDKRRRRRTTGASDVRPRSTPFSRRSHRHSPYSVHTQPSVVNSETASRDHVGRKPEMLMTSSRWVGGGDAAQRRSTSDVASSRDRSRDRDQLLPVGGDAAKRWKPETVRGDEVRTDRRRRSAGGSVATFCRRYKIRRHEVWIELRNVYITHLTSHFSIVPMGTLGLISPVRGGV